MNITRDLTVRSQIYRVKLAAADVEKLWRAADDRGTRPSALLRSIAEVVLRDDIVNAVLDDDNDKPMKAEADDDAQKNIGAAGLSSSR